MRVQITILGDESDIQKDTMLQSYCLNQLDYKGEPTQEFIENKITNMLIEGAYVYDRQVVINEATTQVAKYDVDPA